VLFDIESQRFNVEPRNQDLEDIINYEYRIFTEAVRPFRSALEECRNLSGLSDHIQDPGVNARVVADMCGIHQAASAALDGNFETMAERNARVCNEPGMG